MEGGRLDSAGPCGQRNRISEFIPKDLMCILRESLDALWGLECHKGGARRVRRLLQLSRGERILSRTKKKCQ